VTETIDHHNGAPVAITPDSKVLPRRSGAKGMLPSTWGGRALRLEYVVGGERRETTGTLLDTYPAGPVLNVAGAKTLIAWETVAVVELQED
jgi:hypothetical protein